MHVKLSTLSTFQMGVYKHLECGFLFLFFHSQSFDFPCFFLLSNLLSTLSTILQRLDFTGFPAKITLFNLENPCYNREQIRKLERGRYYGEHYIRRQWFIFFYLYSQYLYRQVYDKCKRRIRENLSLSGPLYGPKQAVLFHFRACGRI